MDDEDCWDALRRWRNTSRLIGSCRPTRPTTITAEAEALATAIRRLGSVVPREALKRRPDLSQP